MLGPVPIMRPLILGNVQVILVPINHQRNLWYISIIEPITGDAAPRRPTTQMTRAILQPAGKQLSLLKRLFSQPSKYRNRLADLKTLIRLDRLCLPLRRGAVELKISALNPPVVKFPPPIRLFL